MLWRLTPLVIALGGFITLGAGAAAETASMTFAVRGGIGCGGFAPCFWIVAEGTITRDTPNRLDEFVTSEGIGGDTQLSGIVISSPGGNLIGSVVLGRSIRENKLNAIVAKVVCDKEQRCDFAPGECYGACVYALAGGVRRKVHEGSKVGVHQFSAHDAQEFLAQESDRAGTPKSGETVFVARRVRAALSRHLAQMRVSPRLLEFAERVPPGHRRSIAANQLRALNISTRVVRLVTRWQLGPHGSGVRLVATNGVWETGGSVQISYSVTFACSQAPRERISVHYAETGNPIAKLELDLLRRYAEHGPHVGLGNDRWIGEHVNRRFTGLHKAGMHTLGFSIYLTHEEVLAIARAKELRIGIQMPSSLNGGIGSVFELDNARDLLATLVRNCASG